MLNEAGDASTGKKKRNRNKKKNKNVEAEDTPANVDDQVEMAMKAMTLNKTIASQRDHGSSALVSST